MEMCLFILTHEYTYTSGEHAHAHRLKQSYPLETSNMQLYMSVLPFTLAYKADKR